MELVTAEQVCDELHIDQSEEELATIGRLLVDSSALIRGSISSDVTDELIFALGGGAYNRLILALVTRMYYDRELSNGYGMGIQIMLNQVRARVLGDG